MVDTPDEALVAEHPDVPREHAIQGFDGVRAYAVEPEESRGFLEQTLGFEPHGDGLGGPRRAAGRPLHLRPSRPPERGFGGAGTVHHVAWATTMDEHEAWRERVAEAGAQPTPVIDRFYFRSVYFREPSGVLFELATIGPGFATDEPADKLGERLSLPPAFEHLRDRLEPALTPLPNPREARTDKVSLTYRTRPAAGEPEGMLVLFHGRGADEHDLFPVLDLLDPEQRLLGVTPRGPLSLPPGGAHWYALGGLGTPDPATFLPTYELATRWLDDLAAETGIPPEKTVLGGFSQGAVMTYSLGLGQGRPRPAALLALSGFVPSVPGFELDLTPPLPPIAIGHGTHDPVIGVEWGRRAKALLEEAGADPIYREYPLPHTIEPGFLVELRPWLAQALPAVP